MKKLLLTAAIVAVFSYPAFAAKKTTTVDADEVVEIARVGREGSARNDFYRAMVNMYGDFGGGTLHLLLSTDGGTTKSGVKYYSGGSLTSFTAEDDTNIEVKTGWGSSDSSTIYYVSMSGSTSPSVTIDVFDNR